MTGGKFKGKICKKNYKKTQNHFIFSFVFFVYSLIVFKALLRLGRQKKYQCHGLSALIVLQR